MFLSVQQNSAPAWWGPLCAADPLSSDPRWLELFARSRGESGTWWFAAGRADRPEIGLRGAVVDAGTRKSMNPHRWLFGRTAYQDREPCDAAGAPEPAAWFPALLCSYPGLDAYPVGAGEDAELVRLLLDGVAGWAAEHGVRLVAVGFAQPERVGFAAGAAAAGLVPVPVATRATLPLAGRAPSEVFAPLSAMQRNNVRRLRARLAAAGVTVAELADPATRLDELVELRCAHARQHGKEADPAEERSWLGPLLATFPSRVVVYGATAAGDPALRGFSLFVDDGEGWTAFVVARRDPQIDRDVYFELMYHVPMEDAAARGVPRLSFGYGTEEAKRRRGCDLVRVPTWYGASDPAVTRWLAATSAASGSAVAPGTAVG